MLFTKKRKIIISLFLAFVVFFILPLTVVHKIYLLNFGNRVENRWSLYEKISEDKQNFKSSSFSFSSNKGQLLKGNIYSYEKKPYKALIVMAHGYGRGSDSYVQEAEYFASNGYLVMSYDNTGTNDSEGESLIGVSQSPIDLNYALKYVESNKELNQFPLMLYGHSWGGFAVTAVNKYDHNVTAIASISGLENFDSLVKRRGEQYIGKSIKLFIPYSHIYEFFKFGRDSFNTGIKGLENTEAQVLIIHSEDDTIVPYKDSYSKYLNKFQGNPNFKFLLLSKYGHNPVLSVNPLDVFKGVRMIDKGNMKIITDFFDEALLAYTS